VHTLAGSGSARYNVLRLFVSPEFDFAEGSLFKPLVGLESKIKRSKKQTINTPFLQFCMKYKLKKRRQKHKNTSFYKSDNKFIY
jgi:hypothetical protein